MADPTIALTFAHEANIAAAKAKHAKEHAHSAEELMRVAMWEFVAQHLAMLAVKAKMEANRG